MNPAPGKRYFLLILAAIVLLAVVGCRPSASSSGGKKTIVVTYSLLGSIVKELVGDRAVVAVPMPNGLDPHEWEPSAKDIATINKADLLVQNGLGLEAGMQRALQTAQNKGVRFFTASDHISIRYVGPGEGVPSGDPDQLAGAPDPHLWMDPIAMKSVVAALAAELKTDFDIDVSSQAATLASQLTSLDQGISRRVADITAENRKLVTGHQSMGYFAARYGLRLVGVIVPSLSSQAGVSAADLAALKAAIQENKVKTVFTELGTNPAVARAIGEETGARVVELTTHGLPADGSYFTFMRNAADVITNALR